VNVPIKPGRDEISCALPQQFGTLRDLLNPHAMDSTLNRSCGMPQAERVEFRSLLLNVSQGYYVDLLRVRRAGVLSWHRHSGPVRAITLRGRWYCLEHDWSRPPAATPLSRAAKRTLWSCRKT